MKQYPPQRQLGSDFHKSELIDMYINEHTSEVLLVQRWNMDLLSNAYFINIYQLADYNTFYNNYRYRCQSTLINCLAVDS